MMTPTFIIFNKYSFIYPNLFKLSHHFCTLLVQENNLCKKTLKCKQICRLNALLKNLQIDLALFLIAKKLNLITNNKILKFWKFWIISGKFLALNISGIYSRSYS